MRGYTDKNGKPKIDWEGRDKKEFQDSLMSSLIRQLNHQYGVTYGIAKVTPEDEANKKSTCGSGNSRIRCTDKNTVRL